MRESIEIGYAATIILCALALIGLGCTCALAMNFVLRDHPRSGLVAMAALFVPMIACPVLFALPVIGQAGVLLVLGCLAAAVVPFVVIVAPKLLAHVDRPHIDL